MIICFQVLLSISSCAATPWLPAAAAAKIKRHVLVRSHDLHEVGMTLTCFSSRVHNAFQPPFLIDGGDRGDSEDAKENVYGRSMTKCLAFNSRFLSQKTPYHAVQLIWLPSTQFSTILESFSSARARKVIASGTLSHKYMIYVDLRPMTWSDVSTCPGVEVRGMNRLVRRGP